MGLPVLLIVVAGADAFSIHDAQADEAAIRKSLPSDAKDVTAIHQRLFRIDGLIPINDFNGYSASPPAGWPASLEGTWKTAMAHCRDLIGPKDLMSPGAMCCSTRLETFLLQRYLDELKVTRFIEVFETSGEGRCAATAIVTDVKARASVEKTGPCAQVAEAVADALAGKGTRSEWQTWEEFGVASKGDPYAARTASTEKVELKKPCSAPPGAITVSGDTVLAKALMKRWAASVPEGGKPLSCTLEQYEHLEVQKNALIPGMRVVSAILRCGDVVVGGEGAKEKMKLEGVDVTSKNLVAALAAKLCR